MVQEGEMALTTLPGEENQSDSVILEAEPEYGLVLTPPEPIPDAPLRTGGSNGVSFILTGLFLLFLIIALRFRNNIKHALSMFRNLVETRTRQNIFDDTVRETSLIILLNILWCGCAGIIGFCVYHYFNPDIAGWNYRAIGMLWGMAIAGVYTIFMSCAYTSVGWVFSDKSHSELWVKGYAASQALMSPALFVMALIGVCMPDTSLEVGLVSAGVFILAKMIFIWKGYRIFFNQFSSWVLFLCYLCSLEIVPLILCYRCAVLLGKML